MATSLPFKAEYAKSGRASCKMCKSTIPKGELRMAIMVTSRFHDGKDAHWFHSQCFFTKHHPPSVGDIEDFESLRYDDQTMIKSKIGSGGSGASAGSSKGKGGAKAKSGAAASGDFSVGYAKSAQSKCAGCEDKIEKNAIRVSKKDYTSERALMYGGGQGFDKWHHLDCFAKIREELEFFDAANKNTLVGFKDLDKEDQKIVQQKLPAVTSNKRKLEDSGKSNGDVPAKKIKTEKGVKTEESEEEKIIQKQNKEMYNNRDKAEAQLKKQELVDVLRANKQEVPDKGGPKAILDLVADIMTFGAMERCKDCNGGQFMYKSGVGYQCTGYISEFTKCDYVPPGDVPRKEFKVPRDLREHALFENKKFRIQKRVIPKHAAPVKALAMSSTKEGPKIIKKPLNGFKFTIFGMKGNEYKNTEKIIKEFGGTVTTKTSSSLAATICPRKEYSDTSKYVDRAKRYGVPVVSDEFVEGIKEVNYKLADELSKYLLSDWVKDVKARLKTLNENFEKPKDEKKSILEKELATVKLKMKDGSVIDPQSGLDDGPYHIYKEGSLVYNCVLNRTSIEEGKNSFYKIQIIESDHSPRTYHVFRAWGRIGTTQGGHQTEERSKQDAVDLFLEKYLELTGNEWGRPFVKKPGAYIRLDIDYGEKEKGCKLIPSKETSKLPMPVQSLVSLIFDVDVMKRTLLEFEIDMNKMPLGKISRKQLLEAYSVLSDSSNMRIEEKDERKLLRKITDISNRFYNLIPHNFGTRMPPLLDNDELFKAKIEMLDNLMEIELAYELLAKGEEGGKTIDSHYKTLSADIDIVEQHSEEFKIIEKYLMNTHAPTHTNYTLSIDQVFKVIRKGENKRYRPFKDLHNRKLLWHGSRVSNFAGIISQGLRIAPPEAPVTGYMFGKGVYFADMVSKSANYCNTSGDNPTGLLLLCEVALGDMHELKHAKDTITKPPKGKHSVKGLGETVPDPDELHTFPDGVMVPYGKPTKAKISNTSLLYNEYIVYDVAQVNIKYLLRVNFNYGRRR